MASSTEEFENLELIRSGKEGVVQTGETQHPEYASPRSRHASFDNWPSNSVVPSDDLVRNGFFYTGNVDYVRCFHCGIGLHDWEIGDDPYTEHYRRFPDCGYIMLCQTSRQRTDHLANQPTCVRTEVAGEELGDDDVTADFMSQTTNSSLSQTNVDDTIPKRSPEMMAQENEKLREQRMCRICSQRDIDVVFMPCAHLISCHVCSYTHKHCPVCRKEIKARIRIDRN